MAFHWYVGDHFENVRMVHDAYPDKLPDLHRGVHARHVAVRHTASRSRLIMDSEQLDVGLDDLEHCCWTRRAGRAIPAG